MLRRSSKHLPLREKAGEWCCGPRDRGCAVAGLDTSQASRGLTTPFPGGGTRGYGSAWWLWRLSVCLPLRTCPFAKECWWRYTPSCSTSSSPAEAHPLFDCLRRVALPVLSSLLAWKLLAPQACTSLCFVVPLCLENPCPFLLPLSCGWLSRVESCPCHSSKCLACSKPGLVIPG